VKKETSKKFSPLVIIFAIISIVGLISGGIYFGIQYQKNADPVVEEEDNVEDDADETEQEDVADMDNESEEEGESEGQENEEAPVNAQNSVYSGTAIDAETPTGWSIVEYFDGAGSDMLVGGVVYDGLTGIEVKHGTVVIFSLKAVNGIGGISACSEVVEFSDTSPTYISDTISEAATAGITTTVIDHTTTTYSEFLIFSNRMRRISHDLYWDMDMTNHSFETNCGLDGTAFPAYGLEFVTDPGTAIELTNTTYWYEMNAAATSAELNTLETILGTITVL